MVGEGGDEVSEFFVVDHRRTPSGYLMVRFIAFSASGKYTGSLIPRRAPLATAPAITRSSSMCHSLCIRCACSAHTGVHLGLCCRKFQCSCGDITPPQLVRGLSKTHSMVDSPLGVW